MSISRSASIRLVRRSSSFPSFVPRDVFMTPRHAFVSVDGGVDHALFVDAGLARAGELYFVQVEVEENPLHPSLHVAPNHGWFGRLDAAGQAHPSFALSLAEALSLLGARVRLTPMAGQVGMAVELDLTR